MALFIGVYTIGSDLTAADVTRAHSGEPGPRARYGVSHLRYWVNEAGGKVFCLIEADDLDLARTVHPPSHGLTAEEIHPVSEHACPRPDTG